MANRVSRSLFVFMMLFVVALPAQAKRYWKEYIAADARNFNLSTPDCMAVDYNRVALHMVYGGDHLYHAWVASNEWHYEVIDDSPAVGQSASITICPNGVLTVIYMDLKNERFMSAVGSDGNWTMIPIAEGLDVGRYNSIVCDSNGYVQIAFSDEQSDCLRYAWLNSSSQWVISTVDSTANGKECSLDLHNNQPRITYFDTESNAVKTTMWNSSTWVKYTIIADLNQTWSAVGFLVDSTDLWHYVYFDVQRNGVYYTTFRPGGWPDQEYWVDTAGAFEQMDLEMTPDGNVMVAYTDSDYKRFKVARGIDADWDVSVVDTGSVGQPKNPALEVWNDSVQYVLYLNQDSSDLKLGISQTALDWTKVSIDTATSYFTDTALAVDPMNRPHLLVRENKRDLGYHCYHDGSGWSQAYPQFPGSIDTDFDLHYLSDGKPIAAYVDNNSRTLELAVYDGNRWNVREVVTQNNGINSIRMAIGSNGSVHLVYEKAGSIELFYLSALSWQSTFTGTKVDDLRAQWTTFDLALNNNNLPCICYPAESTDNLRLKYMISSSSWQTLDFTAKYRANYNIAVDWSGTMHIAAFNSSYQSLYHIWNEGNDWREESITESGDFWPVFDMDVNPGGELCLAYIVQGPSDQIKYAVRRNGSWSKEIVSSGHRYTFELSLVHDPQGVPHIAIGSSYTADMLEFEGLPEVYLYLSMHDVILQQGDRFLLKHNRGNHSAAAVTVDEYILLDIYGAFWFWPSWSVSVDYETVTIPVSNSISALVLDFSWPTGVGALHGLRFWGAIFNHSSQDLIMYDVIEWQAL